MKFPFCADPNTQVTDTRENEDGDVVRRRRRCVKCDKRFTTYERIDLKMPHIVKRNGNRTEFDHAKLAGSMKLALRKRPVTIEDIDAAVDRIEARDAAGAQRLMLTHLMHIEGSLNLSGGQVLEPDFEAIFGH